MTEKHLSLEIRNSDQLIDTLHGISAASTDNGETTAGALRSLRSTLNDRRILTSFPEDGELGLSAYQARPLFIAAGELLANVSHGLTQRAGLNEKEVRTISPDYNRLDEALREAEKLNLPPIRVDLVFDDTTREGKLEISHPIVPDYTPPFKLETAMKRRSDDFESGLRKGGQGGLQTINDLVKESLLQEGLTTSGIQTADELKHPNETVFGGVRRTWIHVKGTESE